MAAVVIRHGHEISEAPPGRRVDGAAQVQVEEGSWRGGSGGGVREGEAFVLALNTGDARGTSRGGWAG